ncbi:MAG: hypothetical protein IJ092_13350 [Atopobiaceae bacterium]|nr:hypothetical protein [Atopobiaceae bacterium]
MAEHENTELPEELMEKIAGGTIPTEMERDILYYVGNLMKAGFGEEDCIRGLVYDMGLEYEDAVRVANFAYN